jgi:hypothetical protein
MGHWPAVRGTGTMEPENNLAGRKAGWLAAEWAHNTVT